MSTQGPIVGRHYVIVERYDNQELEGFLRRAVEAEEAPTWAELAPRLGRLGRWEYEDYQP